MRLHLSKLTSARPWTLAASKNERCHVAGPFRHTVEHQLERFANPETRDKARFKLTQMAMAYTNSLMQQFPDMQRTISHATLAMQIDEALIKNIKK